MLPSTFRPRAAPDFIGPAKEHAVFLEKLIEQARLDARPAPLKLLLLGRPGIGKSELAEHFTRATGAGKWSVSKFNGTQFRIDDVEELKRSMHLTDMFGGYRVIRIEEVDRVPAVAQVALLTLLDDLPPQTAVIATSNCKLKDLEERFQRRFTLIEVSPPTTTEIETLLLKLGIHHNAARQIATFANGNVGQALTDADVACVQAA